MHLIFYLFLEFSLFKKILILKIILTKLTMLFTLKPLFVQNIFVFFNSSSKINYFHNRKLFVTENENARKKKSDSTDA